MSIYDDALEMHEKYTGKISVISKVQVNNEHDLAMAYSPGVAEPCRQIQKDPMLRYKYTSIGNMIAVVSDGSAVLGLGNIGALAGLPVMEGKCVLFKEFGAVNAFPLCLGTNDVNTIVETVKLLEPSFSGINLEDISAPRCFEIEQRLKKETNMVIFHDDQHGTAVVTTAGLINAMKIKGQKWQDLKVVINGVGAAGVSIIKLFLKLGIKDIIACDSKGAIYKNRPEGMNSSKNEIAELTNPEGLKGKLSDVIGGRNVFVGVSVAGQLTKEMIKKMDKNPVIFALANPEPEISVEDAKEAGIKTIATGRSDYPNQVNNVLAFPGIFRGALDVRSTDINDEMKIAAAYAIAELVKDNELNEDYIIPKPFDLRIAPNVAKRVAEAAIKTNVARIKISPEEVERNAIEMIKAVKERRL
ncbi:MAG: NAD-dependent malic enzyme [Actinobacteria bacterium]|nr:NAD-dependent malic enzyme [Cyanobacteriota bacterium]MCL5770950.1 NAD-dependent malic enzyme [Actinomycetota bacterium]